MRLAIIVIGEHGGGKSKTINVYLKSKLGIGKRAHKFLFKSIWGFILSQSFEESGKDIS